jgi:DMSO/TMAO reductase YedYZ molybdopterin-dependent catalytic subunit
MLDVSPDVDHVTVESGDGHYRASIPLHEMRRGGRLLLGLSKDRGGPVRLIVEDGRTLCWNVKRVVALRFTQGSEADSVPENPEH